MSLLTNMRLNLLRYLHAFFVPDTTLHSRQKWVLGLINLAAVVLFWVLSSFLVNAMVEDDKYRKPFFITWINTSCFSFYIIPYLKLNKMSLKQFLNTLSKDWRYSRIPQKDEESLSRIRYGSDDNLTEMESSQEVREEAESSSSPSPSPSPPPPPPSTRLNCEELAKEDGDEDSVDNVNIYETFRLSLQFIILWFSANLVTNASLSYTSVASQTILSSTSSFFTLIIGYLVSIEQINQNKIVGILLSFAGVLIVTKVDTAEDNPNNGQNTSILLILWGNLLAIIGAVIYGIYTILLKFKITIPNSHKEKNLNTHLFFGFVGLVCLLGFWPILIILHFTGVEKFSLPQSSSMAQLLVSNAAITFISDFCWCNAVLLTSPLTVTVGLSMTIPLALIGDWVFKGFQINFIYVFGAAIVTIGFLIINKEEEQDFIEDE